MKILSLTIARSLWAALFCGLLGSGVFTCGMGWWACALCMASNLFFVALFGALAAPCKKQGHFVRTSYTRGSWWSNFPLGNRFFLCYHSLFPVFFPPFIPFVAFCRFGSLPEPSRVRPSLCILVPYTERILMLLRFFCPLLLLRTDELWFVRPSVRFCGLGGPHAHEVGF